MEQTFGVGDLAHMDRTRNPSVVFRSLSWHDSTDFISNDTYAAPSQALPQGWHPNEGWPWSEAHNYDQSGLLTPLTPSPWSPSQEVDTGQDVQSAGSKGEKIAAIHEAQKTKRRDQNRTAQRAYRLRRETTLKNLETQVKSLEAKAKILTAENQRLQHLLMMRSSRPEHLPPQPSSPEVEKRSFRSTSPPTVITNGCTLSSIQEDSEGYTLVLRIDGRVDCCPGAAPTYMGIVGGSI
ncbi:hypothetical protein M409DRAFT_18293 [Zasmidium cellare ATCC 36951]|uniref:BZIP domain-containing protein n=1 Tax=Zasmidium cellare ATCC 36951 TaxID=1080233 RepID=A0A6A6D0K3_ZASCE|nr:uncharacterized protein M409DRAFT_18293 [Zasmidium cellare ATCC 36951]KAF2171176.1 hypothetical protein M409DRAFT_18293 [Zasmidium cellare ATCC 36951]